MHLKGGTDRPTDTQHARFRCPSTIHWPIPHLILRLGWNLDALVTSSLSSSSLMFEFAFTRFITRHSDKSFVVGPPSSPPDHQLGIIIFSSFVKVALLLFPPLYYPRSFGEAKLDSHPRCTHGTMMAIIQLSGQGNCAPNSKLGQEVYILWMTVGGQLVGGSSVLFVSPTGCYLKLIMLHLVSGICRVSSYATILLLWRDRLREIAM